jgi:hypothetical protein
LQLSFVQDHRRDYRVEERAPDGAFQCASLNWGREPIRRDPPSNLRRGGQDGKPRELSNGAGAVLTTLFRLNFIPFSCACAWLGICRVVPQFGRMTFFFQLRRPRARGRSRRARLDGAC